MNKLKDTLEKHYNSISELMNTAREKTKDAMKKAVDIDAITADDGADKIRIEVYKASLAEMKRAMADGKRKAKEVRGG